MSKIEEILRGEINKFEVRSDEEYLKLFSNGRRERIWRLHVRPTLYGFALALFLTPVVLAVAYTVDNFDSISKGLELFYSENPKTPQIPFANKRDFDYKF